MISTEKTRFCYRCGGEYEDPELDSNPVGVGVYNNRIRTIYRYDICPDCFNKFMSWMELKSSMVPFDLRLEAK